MNNRRKIFIGAIVLIVITSFTTFVATSFLYFVSGNLPLFGIFKMRGSSEQYNKINQVKEIIKKYYVEPVDDEKLLEGAVAGVAAAVGDPYTTYMDKKSYDDFMAQTHGSYGGIGVVVSVDSEDNLITVVAPFEGSPGEKAGVRPGDKILKVDGKDVWGDRYEEAVNMMRGPKGTEVTLTISREGSPGTIDITIERDDIVLQTVKHKLLENSIGYIRISMFDEKTAKDFDNALDELYNNNIKGLIIDLRDNPGGVLNVVAQITDRLVPEGLIVYTEDKDKQRNEMYSDKEEINIPLAILVNGGSASASEILSGAVKDHGKGILVGTRTYGKGLVQTLFPLSDGSAVKVTISKYFTPNGTSIQGVGIEPDIVIDLPEELKGSVGEIKEEEDVQLQKAIEVVKGQILNSTGQ